MKNTKVLVEELEQGKYDSVLLDLYVDAEKLDYQRKRYIETIKKYEETLQNKYIDEDDILTILAKKIEESSMFDNSYIYIDEFSGFTRQEYKVIKELLKKAKEIDITICSDEINIQKQPEEDIFYQNKMVIQELIKCAQEVNVNLEENIELKNTYRFKNEELKHLDKNIYDINKEAEQFINEEKNILSFYFCYLYLFQIVAFRILNILVCRKKYL